MFYGDWEMKKLIGFVLLGLVSNWGYAAEKVDQVERYDWNDSNRAIVGGVLSLPAKGIWQVIPKSKDAPSVFVVPAEETRMQFQGDRTKQTEIDRKTREGGRSLRSIKYSVFLYARTHLNKGPKNFSELRKDQKKGKKRYRAPFLKDNKIDSVVYLVPEVEFVFENTNVWSSATNHLLLAFELRPYIDDGKHWVLYTDGVCRREEINKERVAIYKQEIHSRFTRKNFFPDAKARVDYTVLASVLDTQKHPLSFSITNRNTKAKKTIQMDVQNVKKMDVDLLDLFRSEQAWEWITYWNMSHSSVLASWISLTDKKEVVKFPSSRRFGRRRRSDTSIFGVMGGYAAIKETLQIQAIDDFKKANEEKTVLLSSLKGVEVKSHPYKKMLGNQSSGEFALAKVIPNDRFFVYLSKPESLLSFLNDGAAFISKMGIQKTGNNIQYLLKERYFTRFGMKEKWVETFLRSGGVSECALMAPDLFFIEGTEISIVARLTKVETILPMLKMLGLTDSLSNIVEHKNGSGQSVFWILKEDLLLVSTSKKELNMMIQCLVTKGENSLGNSAEFRYMLTQLPLNKTTRAYAYCSDPFIRKLVGPQTKVGQLRRLNEVKNMQRITAMVLRAKLDGIKEWDNFEVLKANGYLPKTFSTKGFSIGKDLVVHSAEYGTLRQLKTLDEVSLEKITPSESTSYKEYVRNYSQLWKKFFDPIALRLDDIHDGSLEATIFILPLIDASFYNEIKEILATKESHLPFKIPQMSPPPIVQLSVNLTEKSWLEITKNVHEIFQGYLNIHPAIMDDLGSSLHLFIHDADPIIALGSGDLLGVLNGQGGNLEEISIPLILSVITRPCTIAIETKNPEQTRAYLRNAVSSFVSQEEWERTSAEFYQVGDADSWVCYFDIMGMVKIRLGIDVKENFLLIRNLPWSTSNPLISVKNAELHTAGFQVVPSAGKLQLPGLHSTAAEQSRLATMQAFGFLFPVIRSGQTLAIEEAKALHLKVFGFVPSQADQDSWSWTDGELQSKLYGTIYKKRQPPYTPGDTQFGLLQTIEKLEFQMQFEQSGLRTKIRWKTR